jgi:ATP-dependent RNA helicase DDX52/ROK1
MLSGTDRPWCWSRRMRWLEASISRASIWSSSACSTICLWEADVVYAYSYDFPQTTTSYIHRIGRTARFNRPGTAVTLFTKDDAPYLRTIVNVMRSSGLQVPEWMLKLQAPTKKDKQKLKNKPVERMQVRHAGGYHVEEKKGKRKGAKEEGKAAGGGKPKAKKRKVDLSES